MGRSSSAEAARSRQRVLQTASDLFRSRSVEQVTIAEIMAAAGMTAGGFYKHFESKDALATEACVLAFQNALDAWKHEASGSAALQKLVAYYLSPKPPERACPMVTLGPAVAAFGPDHSFTTAYRDGVRALLAAFAEAAAADGGWPDSGQLQSLFSAMVGTNFLSGAIGLEPWVKDLQVFVLERAGKIGRQ